MFEFGFSFVFVFPFLSRKNLSHSGRFGMEDNKHERKVFFYPETGGGVAFSLCSPRVVHQIVRLSRVNLQTRWYSPWQALVEDSALLLASPPPPTTKETTTVPPQRYYEWYFLARIPTSFLIPCPDLVYQTAPKFGPACSQVAPGLSRVLGTISLLR